MNDIKKKAEASKSEQDDVMLLRQDIMIFKKSSGNESGDTLKTVSTEEIHEGDEVGCSHVNKDVKDLTIILTPIIDKKHPFENVSILEPHENNLLKSYAKWINEGWLKNHAQKCIIIYNSFRSAGHDSSVMAEVNKLAKILPLYLSLNRFYHVQKDTDWSRDESYMDKSQSDPLEVRFVDHLP
ncbi:hypothetical protein HAX54_017520 [Datura stramonium]|uniref:Uncharacterized protein n=1 Tax=Datura stramonium TaxID=4076 RepID=A0ABS8UN39_DATST|nr:hypothetical protein [Datura stramonium]